MPIKSFIEYNNIEDVNFPWTYSELMDLPLFMIQEIFQQMDKQAEQAYERKRKLQSQMDIR